MNNVIMASSSSWRPLSVFLDKTGRHYREAYNIQVYVGPFIEEDHILRPIGNKLDLRCNRVQLIKAVRQEFRVNLREAKEAVEELIPEVCRKHHGVLVRWDDPDEPWKLLS